MNNQSLSLKLNDLINQCNRYKDVSVTKSAYLNLINYIDDLINEYGHYIDSKRSLSLLDLTSSELDKLIALKIEDDERDTSDLFYQSHKFSQDDSLTDALVNMLKNNARQKEYMEAIRQHVFDYYSDSLQDLIDQRCQILDDKYYA